MISIDDILGDRAQVAALRVLSSTTEPLSGHEVARRAALPQSTVRRALERLIGYRVVRRTNIGRSAAYALMSEREFVRTLLLPLFEAERALSDRLRTALAKAVGRLAPAPVFAAYYGSAARNDPSAQDIDLLLVARDRAAKDPLLTSAVDEMAIIERRYGLPVHPVILTQEQFASPAQANFLRNAAATAWVLKGTPTGAFRYAPRWPVPGSASARREDP